MEEIRDKVSRIDTKVEVIHTNVGHLDECLDEFKNEMLGRDRRSGIVGELRTELRRLWWAWLALLLAIMGAGSGTISLKSLLEMLGK